MKRFLLTLLLAVFLLSACGQNEVLPPEKVTVPTNLQTAPEDTQITQSDTTPLPLENPVTIWVRTQEKIYDHRLDQVTTTSSSYNQNGDYIFQVCNRDDKEIFRSEYEYDAAARLQKITHSYEGVVDQTMQYTYDTDKYSITSIYYNKKGKEVIRFVDTYAYDGSWSENVAYYAGKEKSRSSLKYDSDGNCVEQIEYINGVEANVTTYTYDVFGNKTLTVHTKNGVEAYRYIRTYDTSNRLTEFRNIQGGKETYSTYVYDMNGNLIETYESNGGEPVLNTSYHYDGNGNLTERTTYQKDADLQDSTTTEQFEYDQNNNCIVQHTFRNGEKGISFYYVYDENNNRLQSQKIGADGVVQWQTTCVYRDNNLIKKEFFKNNKLEETTEMTWVKMVVEEEKAVELYKNNGTEGDYQFEDTFVQKMKAAGITFALGE